MSRATETLLPEGWPRPKGYANGIRVPAGRDLVFVAGMVGWDGRERIVSPDFVAQFEQALKNVLAVVETAGGTAEDIVRMTVFVTDLDAYSSRLAEIGQSWRSVMGRSFPAMALLQVAGLLEKGAMVEIEATAAVASKAEAAE
jgi:enamine deaminase RidA (YjgF/YER057c/UK114 family)